MALFQKLTAGILKLIDNNGAAPQVRSGPAVTRAAVLAETEDGVDNPPVGSVYLSTGANGHVYVRVSASSPGVSTDWQVVTTSAAD